jgi:protein-disulfide isomerase
MKALIRSLAGAAMIVLAGFQPGMAQTSEEITTLKQEIETLKQGQAAIAKELAAIREILERATGQRRERPFEPTNITVADAPFLGQADAPVTVVEFTDYQCPFCRRHNDGTLKQLLAQYVETGKVRYVMREFPIASLHPRRSRAPRRRSAPRTRANTGRCTTASSPSSAGCPCRT